MGGMRVENANGVSDNAVEKTGSVINLKIEMNVVDEMQAGVRV